MPTRGHISSVRKLVWSFGWWLLLEISHLSGLAAAHSLAPPPRGPGGNTPLHFAALEEDINAVEQLIKAGVAVRATNQAGATALHYGAGNERIVELLLSAGADPNARSTAGITPLHCASARPESNRSVKRLLDAGAQVDAPRPVFPAGSVTSLTLATLAGEEGTVRLLLERGASPGGTNGFTPVAAAAFAGRERILKILVSKGGSVNCDDGFAGTALNNAFYTNHRDLVPYLLEHGADLHQKSSFGEGVPPMVWTAYHETGDLAQAKALLDRGVDINETTSAGDTALRWALKRGETPLTSWLRAHGASEGVRPLKQKSIPNHSVPDDPAARERMLRDSVQRALDLLQQSSDGFLDNGFVQQSACVSCHQQTLPAVAFGKARERGFRLSEERLARQLRVQQASWSRTRDSAYEMYEPQPASAANLGYGLRGLHALRYEPDALTDAMVWYLAAAQLPDGSWPDFDWRPPMESGPIAGTALAVSALQLYPQPFKSVNLDKTIAKARRWLESSKPTDLSQRVFRLLGLHWARASSSSLRPEMESLLALQRSDGGWAPLTGLPSDSWATGHTLVALAEAGGLAGTDAAYQRGVAFLLRTQFPDGSWWVPSRTWPFQPHFDSRFPHGKDQWISAAGTAWAALALLNTIEPNVATDKLATAQALIARTTPTKPAESVANHSAPAGQAEMKAREFSRDIQPLLQRSCAACHSGDKPKGDFRVDTLEHLFVPGQSREPAIVKGQSAQSLLVRFITDQVEDLEMPPKNRRTKYPALSSVEVQQIKEWIDQGAR